MVELFFNLWLFSTPFLLAPWAKLYGALPLGTIYIILFLLLLIGYIWKRGFYEFLKNIKDDFLKPPLVFLTLFLLIYVISLILNIYRIPAQVDLVNAVGFKKPVIYNLVTLGFLTFSILNLWIVKRLSSEKSLKIWIWASLLPLLYGFYQIFIYDPSPHFWWDTYNRLHSTAGEAQVFGNYLLSVILLPIFTGIGAWGLVLFALQFGGLILTWSVGAWLGLGAGCAYVVIKVRQEALKFLLKIILMGLVAIAVLFLAKSKYMTDGFKTIVYKLVPYERLEAEDKRIYAAQFSQEDRSWLRQAAFKMFKDSPLIGVGPGNFGFLHNQYVLEEKMKRPYIAKAHNAYLEILAETGILGFAAFAGFIISLFWLSFRNFNLINIVLQASLLAILVQGAGFGILVHSYTWIVMGFVLGRCNTETQE